MVYDPDFFLYRPCMGPGKSIFRFCGDFGINDHLIFVFAVLMDRHHPSVFCTEGLKDRQTSSCQAARPESEGHRDLPGHFGSGEGLFRPDFLSFFISEGKSCCGIRDGASDHIVAG